MVVKTDYVCQYSNNEVKREFDSLEENTFSLAKGSHTITFAASSGA